MCQDDAVDDCGIIDRTSGNRLDDPLFGEIDIVSLVGNTAVRGLFYDIDSNSRRIDDIYINLVNERNVRYFAVMILQSHHEGVLTEISAGNKGFDLLRTILCVPVYRRSFKIEQHQDHCCAD